MTTILDHCLYNRQRALDILLNSNHQTYRVIQFSQHDAATNMAVDEAILEAHITGLVPPTLRLYQFTPPAVSFGYAQNISEAQKKNIQTKGFDLVRRPTGGRAVLHYGDLTYSFVCSSTGAPINNYALVSQSIVNAYKEICQALITSLNFLGMELSLGTSQTNYRNKDDCFSATTTGDLQFQGNKIIGSAQLRRRHGVLQHGSIILRQPQELMHELMTSPNSQTPKQENHQSIKHHVNLLDEIKQTVTLENLQQLFIQGFAQTFNCQFLPSELTNEEKITAQQLKSKYQKTDARSDLT